MPDRVRQILGTVCVALGAVVVVLGVVAGYANHVLLDTDTFASKVDAVRQVEPVSRVVGRTLADQYLQVRPDQVAIRPLLDSLGATVVASPAFSRPTRIAAESFQQAVTQPDANVAVLRIADAGAVLTSVLQHVSPAGPQSTPSTVPLNLASIGGQSWSANTIQAARHLSVAAWLMPLLGLALLALSVLLSRRHRRATLYAGLAVLAVTAVVAVLLLIANRVAAAEDETTLRGALIKYGWAEFAHPLWWWLAGLTLLALMVVASAASLLPEYDASLIVARAWGAVRRRPRSFVLDLVRALAFVVVGVFTLVDPLLAAKVTGAAVSAAVVLYGMSELGRATNDEEISLRRAEGRDQTARAQRSRPVLVVVVVTLLLATGGYVAWAASSTRTGPIDTGPVAGKGQVCDGYAALCERPFNDVSFAATHNAMAVAGEPGWFLGEQGRSIIGQLDDGVRALQIDVWQGQPRVSGGTATAPGSYAEAKAVATRELGPEIVDAGLRVFNAVADPTPSGPPELYLCHGLCELGATNFATAMTGVRVWLDTHPDETLTLIIERHVSAAEIGATLTASGLAAYAYQPKPATPWPTLREMITSGHRLVAMLETESGGPAYPWLVDGYSSFLQETPFTFRTKADFSCATYRGPDDAPLFLINHWVFGFRSLVTDARAVNTLAVLGGRAEQCRQERRLPNFIAVNYADIGDVHQVVNRLNGVG